MVRLALALTTLFWITTLACRVEAARPDPLSEHVQLPYPYALGYVGVRVERRLETADRPIASPHFLGVIDVTAGWIPDDIARGSVALRLTAPGRLDVELRYSTYLEQSGSSLYAISLGRLGFAFTLVDTDAVQMRGSIGGLLYVDAVTAAVGTDAVLEMDVYPGEPTRLSFEAGGGLLGDAFLLEGRASFGVHIDRCEIYFGYQVLTIFPQSSSPEAVLHGPIVGVRVWIS